MGFYRFKLSPMTYFMLEAGLGTTRTSMDGYSNVNDRHIMAYYLEAEFFGKVSSNTMLTLNPGISFTEDNDTAYGIGLGVILFGDKRSSNE
jgi:hypothetical protein